MKIFKFGGASVNNPARIRNVANILRDYEGPIVVVVSAMGKTTNALEKVAGSYYSGDRSSALQLFENIKAEHMDVLGALGMGGDDVTMNRLKSFFTEVEWLLHDQPVRGYDYYYDQIVCSGELLSTAIISGFLQQEGIRNQWVDVRDIIRTDDNFREANIDFAITEKKVQEIVVPIFNHSPVLVTQGFVGSTDENESTTLGREGSDYTAAVFANLLNAESVTIWKDVEGVMNADPKQFPNAQYLSELNYNEVIEMAYYGAQVIHPKTIKPLQNKHIPLLVKCFTNKSLPGTVIHNNFLKSLPPIIVEKQNQVLMHLRSKDFSFVGEKPVADLYQMMHDAHVRPNLIQTGAVSINVCLDGRSDKVESLASAASQIFDVEVEKNLVLLTIRHYTPDLVSAMTSDKKIVLQQQSPEIIQVLLRA